MNIRLQKKNKRKQTKPCTGRPRDTLAVTFDGCLPIQGSHEGPPVVSSRLPEIEPRAVDTLPKCSKWRRSPSLRARAPRSSRMDWDWETFLIGVTCIRFCSPDCTLLQEQLVCCRARRRTIRWTRPTSWPSSPASSACCCTSTSAPRCQPDSVPATTPSTRPRKSSGTQGKPSGVKNVVRVESDEVVEASWVVFVPRISPT